MSEPDIDAYALKTAAAPWGRYSKRWRVGRQPLNHARGSLDALAMVFAAIASARIGVPVAPGAIRSLASAEG